MLIKLNITDPEQIKLVEQAKDFLDESTNSKAALHCLLNYVDDVDKLNIQVLEMRQKIRELENELYESQNLINQTKSVFKRFMG